MDVEEIKAELKTRFGWRWGKNGLTNREYALIQDVADIVSNRLEKLVSKGDPQPVQTAETFTEAELGYIHSSLKCWKHEIKLDRSVDKHFDRVLDKIWRMQQLA